MSLRTKPHRRLNALTGEWVLVSPHRTQRPWQGQMERVQTEALPPYDPDCYLCPGNRRANGEVNPPYQETFVFTNDYAALIPDAPPEEETDGGLLQARSERGICRVVCYSPDHSLTLGQMETSAIARVVDEWVRQYEELSARPEIAYVQIFENRGQMMGCSNPHPHGQIWSNEHLPTEIIKEERAQREYFARHGRALLDDYLARELQLGERIVCENDGFVLLVPYWAVWPFETMVLCRRPRTSLAELSSSERFDLADILRRAAARYDNVFNAFFPYSMGFHQQPAKEGREGHWRLHAHFHPPLLRSATVRKFLVGYELLAMPQRDITPEAAAATLRACSETPLGRDHTPQK